MRGSSSSALARAIAGCAVSKNQRIEVARHWLRRFDRHAARRRTAAGSAGLSETTRSPRAQPSPPCGPYGMHCRRSASRSRPTGPGAAREYCDRDAHRQSCRSSSACGSWRTARRHSRADGDDVPAHRTSRACGIARRPRCPRRGVSRCAARGSSSRRRRHGTSGSAGRSRTGPPRRRFARRHDTGPAPAAPAGRRPGTVRPAPDHQRSPCAVSGIPRRHPVRRRRAVPSAARCRSRRSSPSGRCQSASATPQDPFRSGSEGPA